MCCVGTKNAIADYHYIVKRFLQADAVSVSTAVTLKDLKIDFFEHIFARDNFESLLRVGDVVPVEDKFYLAKRRNMDEGACTPKACAYISERMRKNAEPG